MVAQMIYDGLVRSAKSSSPVGKVLCKILSVVRRMYLLVSDPLIDYSGCYGRNFKMRFSHQLGIYESIYPYYGLNLARIVGVASEFIQDLSCIDIGANVGDTAFLIRSKSDVPVLCVEGDDGFFSILQRNVSDEKDIELDHVFVGDKNDVLDCAVSVNNGTGRLDLHGTNQKVKVRTIGEILERHQRFRMAKLLKIDTDGYDTNILSGAIGWLENARPIIFFEYDPHLLEKCSDQGPSIWDKLAGAGYRMALIYDNFGELMYGLDIRDADRVQEMHSYFSGRRSLLYADICLFHSTDAMLFEEVRKRELQYFSAVRP